MEAEALQDAEKLVSYFERLVAAGESGWERQLLVAQIWRSLLRSGERVARDEFLRLASDLNEASDLGTGYEELVFLIGRWVEE